MEDKRNTAERLLNAAADHIAATHEQPTDRRAWGMLATYCPEGELIAAALRRFQFSGRLVLDHPLQINGITYEPATYILTHVGPAPASDAL